MGGTFQPRDVQDIFAFRLLGHFQIDDILEVQYTQRKNMHRGMV